MKKMRKHESMVRENLASESPCPFDSMTKVMILVPLVDDKYVNTAR